MSLIYTTTFPAYVGATAGSLIANPSGEITYVKSLYFFNNNTTDEVVTLYYVPNSANSLGAAAVTNKINVFTVPLAQAVDIAFEGLGFGMSGTNDSFQASTNTASKVNFDVTYGRE